MRAQRRNPAEDDGFTLIEVLVSTVILGIFLAIFAGSTTQIFDSVNVVEGTAISQSQINTAFVKLDTAIRYAAAVSTPGSAGGNPYVEWLTTNTGTNVCTELRWNSSTGQLQRRTWTQSTSTPVPTAWTPLANGLTAATFTVSPADTTYAYPRLRLQLSTANGSGAKARKRQSDVTFTALNNKVDLTSPSTCTEGRAVA